jgi:hypothetical protein
MIKAFRDSYRAARRQQVIFGPNRPGTGPNRGESAISTLKKIFWGWTADVPPSVYAMGMKSMKPPANNFDKKQNFGVTAFDI